MQGGKHAGQLFPEILVVPAWLHFLEYEQTRRGGYHIRRVRPSGIAEFGQAGGFDCEYVPAWTEQGFCEYLGIVLERYQARNGDHSTDGLFHPFCGEPRFTEPIRKYLLMRHLQIRNMFPARAPEIRRENCTE